MYRQLGGQRKGRLSEFRFSTTSSATLLALSVRDSPLHI
jgi:hypothetical protein